ncbi:hypothetical protein CMQ_5904 [Grosmannia clavigera kw1407]|uniref:Uncharacterized protein n=1 Tax=Grosmannia clavigera (strain kw1407 / UAMH 11150) TaxID=655863 RepID=F0XIG4_GROCL|nr:uncharacterized protein CMQ_5904 [Grosmannia clavigera kw1407]EFX02543.1 hypothetical protein CMQ_5904 [Grosmannia clavigera kw1407]
MGNLCGKVDSDAFEQPGRVLGSADAVLIPGQPRTAAVPPQATLNRVGGPPRTLGGEGSSGAADDVRRKAAEAAEARNAPKSTGKLGSKLDAQRKESRMDTLKKASADEVRRREMDAAAQATSHN